MDTKQIVGFLEEALNAAPGTFQEADPLDGLEGWDSIGIISVMSVVEDHCGVSLDPEALAACRTVGDLARLIAEGSSGN